MGKAFLFACPTCNYETWCSLQVDRGFTEQKKPMICLNCKTLENRTIGRFESKNSREYNEITPTCNECGTMYEGEMCEMCEMKEGKACEKCGKEKHSQAITIAILLSWLMYK
jgi:hypothetical protein